jgi:hypothetical protein
LYIPQIVSLQRGRPLEHVLEITPLPHYLLNLRAGEKLPAFQIFQLGEHTLQLVLHGIRHDDFLFLLLLLLLLPLSLSFLVEKIPYCVGTFIAASKRRRKEQERVHRGCEKLTRGTKETLNPKP